MILRARIGVGFGRLGRGFFALAFRALCIGFCLHPTAVWADGVFELGFDGPVEISGTTGDEASASFGCTLTSLSDELGAQAWCIGVRASNAAIEGITTEGTAVEEFLKEDGFQRSEVTVGPGNEGAISCVILSLHRRDAALPPAGSPTIAKLDVRFKIPEECSAAELRYSDGLRLERFPPVWNIVLSGFELHRPVRGALAIDVFNAKHTCNAPEPSGSIRAGSWNFLLPLTNRYGCNGGGPANMLRNWVVPNDLAKARPQAGESWKIDFETAASAGFEAGGLYSALGLNNGPIWASLAWLTDVTGGKVPRPGTCDPPVNLDCEDVDLKGIVGQLNGVAADFALPTVPFDNVLAVAQTYVENRGGEDACLDLCLASDDSAQVWVNDDIVINRSACGEKGDGCERFPGARLSPGVNKITVVCWQGDGDWGFRLSLIDPATGDPITSENQTRIAFLGTSPGEATLASPGLLVTRVLEHPDCCPGDGPGGVTLKGNGRGSGDVHVVETFVADPGVPGLDALGAVSEVSHGGEVTLDGGVPVIDWTVPAEVLNAEGVSYRVEVAPGRSVRPIGRVDDCAVVRGADELKGSWPHTGPLGAFDDTHDLGTAEALAAGPGSTVVDTGLDASPGSSDDIYTLRGSGAGVGDAGDSLHFAYHRVAGDFEAEVKVVTRSFPVAGGRHASYGIMARRDCSLASRYTFVYANLEADPGPDADHVRGDGVFHGFRQSHGSAAPNSAEGFPFPDPDGEGPALANQPDRFRLVRRGPVLTSYASFEGGAWKLIGTDTWYGLSNTTPLLVGLACVRGDASPDAGIVSFTEFSCTPPAPTETFQNESNEEGSVVYSQSFDELEDGTTPPGYLLNCAGDCDTFHPTIVGGRLRLSQEGVHATSASAFLNIPLPVGSGTVIVEYTVYFSQSGVTMQPPQGDPNPGEGLTMMLLAGQKAGGVGAPGSGLGYDGLTRTYDGAKPSFSVECDAWSSDAFFNEGTGSPLNDGAWHLGLDTGGSVHSVAINSATLPDIFDPKGVRFRVVYHSQGQVTVSIVTEAAGEGAGGGVVLGGAATQIDSEVEPLATQGDELGLLGFTASTGDGTQNSEIDDVVVVVVECSDSPETAAISGPRIAHPGDPIEFDASGSDAGAGDSSEVLFFKWSVSGDAQIEGSANSPRVALRTSSSISDGEAILRVEVDDGNCRSPLSSAAERRIKVTDKPTNWASYDANKDGQFDLADAILHLLGLFSGFSDIECAEAMDFNGDAKLDLTDPIAALTYLFMSGAPPARGAGCQFIPNCELSGSCP